MNRLVLLFADPERPPEVLEASGGEVLRHEAMRPGEAADWTPARTILVVPGAEVAARWLDLPAASDAQARSAAGFMLEAALAAAPERQHIAVGPRGEGPRLTAVVDAPRLQGWLDRAAALGVEADVVTPDHLILPPADEGLVGVRFGPLLAVRGPDLALSGEPELLAAVLGDRTPAAANPLDAAALLARGAEAPVLNLLQGAFAPGGERSETGGWKRAAVLAALVLISPLLIAGAQIARNSGAAFSLEGRADRRAVAMAPSLRGTSDPAGQALARLEARRAADRFLDLSAATFQVVQASGPVRMETLVYGEDAALRISVAYANYSDLDTLKAVAAQAGLDMVEDSTVTEGGRISTDLIVRSAR
ncbi:MAG: ral secretion pathway protein [Caulobacter sp.]|nr:ral secretion pathway protein [Caulobacter sp.]